MFRTAFLMMVAAAINTPAIAGNSTGQAQAPANAEKPEDKVVCRYVNTTGSRLRGERQCKTRAQWGRESDETRDQIEQQEQRATGDAMNAPH